MCAAAFRSGSSASSWTSFRTPIRCRPRSCCCLRPTIRRVVELARRPPRPRQALHRRRSQAVDLSLPPRRCRHLSRCLRHARSSWGQARHAEHQLPRAAEYPAHDQCGVRTCDDEPNRRNRRIPNPDRPGYVPLEPFRPDLPDQPSVVVLPVRSLMAPRRVANISIEEVSSRRRRRLRRLAHQRKRLEGRGTPSTTVDGAATPAY